MEDQADSGRTCAVPRKLGTKSSGKWKASEETKVLRTKRDHNEVIHHGDSKI